jgi:hypothetical protein
MFAFFKKCSTKRNRNIALVLLGASFAIQMVPPVMHHWSEATGASDEVVMAVMIVVYLALLAFALYKGRDSKS